MPQYYSQHGEDILLDAIFSDQKTGFFVEVGCIDGRRFSNTLIFEERGWRGLCIEAHAGYTGLLKKNRPKSIICHRAIADENKNDVAFFANDRGSLSTLNPNREKHFKELYGDFFSGFTKQLVKQRRLDYLLKLYNISAVDILSIDIEGEEALALKSFDFTRIKPRVIVVEVDSREQEEEINNILLPVGYRRPVRLHNNNFYVLLKADHKKIKNICVYATITHTEHPLDNNGDKKIKVMINTRPFYKKLLPTLRLKNKLFFNSQKEIIPQRVANSLTTISEARSIRVYISTVIRETKDSNLTGYLNEIDWPSGIVKKQIKIPVFTKSQKFWSDRGGNRGGRGVFIYNDIVYLATAMSIRKYDLELNFLEELTHQKFAGIHEIHVDDKGIWVTSTVHDLLIHIDHRGNIIHEWSGSSNQMLQKRFSFTSRRLNFDLDFPQKQFAEQYDAYCREERLHLNTVQVFNNYVYTFASKIGALIRVLPGPEKIILYDPEIIGGHNCYLHREGYIVVNRTEQQAIRIYNTNNGKLIKQINTKLFKADNKSTQFSSAGWQRGLCFINKSLCIVGTSPATIFEADIKENKIGKIVRLDNNIKHCIHGLTILND